MYLRRASLPVIGLIAALLLFSQLPAQAAPPTQSVNAHLTGYVSDLGEQSIVFRGNGGNALLVSDIDNLETKALSLAAGVRVIDSSVTGSGRLHFEGTAKDGTKVSVQLNFQIAGGDGLKLPCDLLPEGSPCDSRDIIPLAYMGAGVASIAIGSSESKHPVTVVIDASNHPKLFGGNYKVTAYDSDEHRFLDFNVNVSKYEVHYRNGVGLGQVTGDLVGEAMLIVDSREDHTALPSGTSSIDSGEIQLRVMYNEEVIEMQGNFRGTSTGWPLYPYVISTGTFKTRDDATLRGTYTTTWDTPFTFTTEFVGNIHVKK